MIEVVILLLCDPECNSHLNPRPKLKSSLAVLKISVLSVSEKKNITRTHLHLYWYLKQFVTLFKIFYLFMEHTKLDLHLTGCTTLNLANQPYSRSPCYMMHSLNDILGRFIFFSILLYCNRPLGPLKQSWKLLLILMSMLELMHKGETFWQSFFSHHMKCS